jgi:hypothetical protein
MVRREPISIGSENALDIAWAIYRTICDRKLRLRPVPYIRLFAVGGRPLVSDWSGGRHIDNLPAGTRRTRQRVDERNRDLFINYHDPMHSLSRSGFARVHVFVGLIVFFVPAVPTRASAPSASGRFEVYCDGVGLFLAKIDGAPASGKLVLFSPVGGTFGGEYIGQGKWSAIYVFRDGCLPDGKCDRIANGRVWIDAPDARPKHISGKYEIQLNGKLLEGTFLAKRRVRKPPLRLCM